MLGSWARVALVSWARGPLAQRTAGAMRCFSAAPVGESKAAASQGQQAASGEGEKPAKVAKPPPPPRERSRRPPKPLGSKPIKPVTPLAQAIPLVKSKAWARFDEGVEIALRLNIDPRKPEQNVRGVAVLPKGTGKKVNVAVFATGPAAEEAKAAGAQIVGGDELVDKVKEGFLEFDRAIATPAMMKSLSKIAKILGPRGLMPNPKTGTVTDSVGDMIRKLSSGVTFKAEKAGIVHAGLGRCSFSDADLLANVEAFVDAVHNARPRGVKEPYVKSAFISTTMSESVRLDNLEINRMSKVKVPVSEGKPGKSETAPKGLIHYNTIKPAGRIGWFDKANAVDWDQVDPTSVPSRSLRMYLQARREVREKELAGKDAAA